MNNKIPIKRTMDVLLSLIGILLLSPMFIVISLLIVALIGRPVLFKQMRPGLFGHPFRLVKFRSMKDSANSDGTPLPDSQRLTGFGRLLRATSLDELPELWNVLKGDMSLVGPRPLLMEYLPLYNDRQKRRHEVRPGITGWAQINGRNAISWEQKFELDLYYVEKRSLWLDLKILFLTLKKVFAREGINSISSVTMEKFAGNDPK